MKIANRLYSLSFVLSSTLAFASTVSLGVQNEIPVPIESHWNEATAEALNIEINRIGEDIRKKVDASNETKKKLEHIWDNPNYTSDAVKAKRKALETAEAALIKAKIELRAEVSKLPEVQKISEDNEKLQENIKALRLKNTALIKLFRSKKTKQNN